MCIIEELIAKQHSLVEAQPTDPNHERLTRDIIEKWGGVTSGVVVDVGCGQGIARPFWLAHGYQWIGITIGPDFQSLDARKLTTVHCEDMHFVSRIVSQSDLIYARHVLEHSPFPVLALADWVRVAPLLIVVVPKPDQAALAHRGHISVFEEHTWLRLFRFVGLKIKDRATVEYDNPQPWPQGGAEYRFLLERE